MASERLPGKPLALIRGIPMIIRVAKVCLEVVGRENLTVSTPDSEIIEVCKSNNIPAIFLLPIARQAQIAYASLHNNMNLRGM